MSFKRVVSLDVRGKEYRLDELVSILQDIKDEISRNVREEGDNTFIITIESL